MPNLNKTLFVCTGNIYRSIISERLFKQSVRKNGLPFQVRSRDTNPYFKAPNTLLNHIVEKEYAIKLNDHRAQKLTLEDVLWASAIVCFTVEHKETIIKICPAAKEKTFLINEIASLNPRLFHDVDYYDVSENNDSLLSGLQALKESVDTITRSISLSVVMAVYNEEKNIKNILTKLIAQSSQYHVKEIIVVSSGCTDKTNGIIKSIKSPLLIEVKEDTRNGKVSALKKAAPLISGGVVLLIDGDVDIGDDFIKNCFSCIYSMKIPCTGKVVPIPTENRFFYKLAKVSCDAWNNLRDKQNKAGKFLYPSGYTLLVSHRNFIDGITEVNDTIINDDGQFSLVLFQKGIMFHYSDRLKVNVTFPQSFSDFFRQKIRTRMGRRQASGQFFKDIEKQWRGELIKMMSARNFPLVAIFLIMDGIARLIASIKIRFSYEPHLWTSVETTKDTQFSRDVAVTDKSQS